jgi:hypothetical protein
MSCEFEILDHKRFSSAIVADRRAEPLRPDLRDRQRGAQHP